MLERMVWPFRSPRLEFYRRYTWPEFLDHGHPRIDEFYRYWDGKRLGRRMPSRADIDPSEILPFLPGIILVGVERNPLRLTYRLVGTREVEARGNDPTGKSVFTHCIGAEPDEVIATYRHVIDGRQAVFDPEVIRAPGATLEELGCLLLPPLDDDETVSQVLVYTHYQQATPRELDLSDIASAVPAADAHDRP